MHLFGGNVQGEIDKKMAICRVTRRLEINHPIFGNVAKTVARISKLTLILQNNGIKRVSEC